MSQNLFFSAFFCTFLQDFDAKMKKQTQKAHNFGLLLNAGGHENAVLAP